MKVIIRTNEDSDYRRSFELEINNKGRVYISDNLSECPEDATLGRSLNFVYDIENMIKEAYDAGKAGEELNIAKEETKEGE